MDLYVKAGLTPLEAIRAATHRSARSLGIDADHGTLESGKRADFLVLGADPLRGRQERAADRGGLQAGRTSRSVKRRGALAAGLAVAAASAALFLVSQGSWSDALIDSGREWIVPDALARGELLYRDVVYWFGPFTPYFQAAFLRVFGSGFAALVVAGAAAAAAILAVLDVTLCRVAGRRAALAWTALAIPALVFMPNAGGALLGMGYRIWHAAAFALAAVALASRPPGRRPALAVLGAGACAGLAGLCRTEWGLAAAGAMALAAFVRARRSGEGVRRAAVGLAGCAAVFAAGLGVFLWRAGAGAVLGDGHVLLTGLPPETRHFLIAFSGLPDWRRGLLEMLYSLAMWGGVFALAAWLAWPASRRRPRGLALALVRSSPCWASRPRSAAPAAPSSSAPRRSCARRGSSPAGGGARDLQRRCSRPRDFWGWCSATAGRSTSATRRTSRRRCSSRSFAPRGSCGWPRRRAGLGAERASLEGAFSRVAAALVVAAFAGRAWQYASIEAEPVPGTSGLLWANPDLAREIAELAAAVRDRTKPGDGLAVFPEGELLNFLSARPNPIRHQLYLPGYLSSGNETEVLRELEASPPGAIVLWRRPVSEYDRALFGMDYGTTIRDWIDRRYELQPFRASGAPARANPRFIVGWRR